MGEESRGLEWVRGEGRGVERRDGESWLSCIGFYASVVGCICSL